jgi:hypothetical protein
MGIWMRELARIGKIAANLVTEILQGNLYQAGIGADSTREYPTHR